MHMLKSYLILASALLLVAGCASPQKPSANPAQAAPGATATQIAPSPTRVPATAARPASSSPTAAAIPSLAPTATVTPVASANVTISEPLVGAKISNPVKVKGTARVFEAHLQVQVKDASGKVIGKKTVVASIGAPEWGTFETDLPFEAPTKEQQGVIEAFDLSARDGTVQDLVSLKVVLPAK